MPHLTLTSHELAVLRGAVRKGDVDAGFHELLVTLDRLADRKTGQLFLSQPLLDTIQHYGSKGSLTWQASLFAIFGRTLGDSLGRTRDSSGRLITHKLTNRDPESP